MHLWSNIREPQLCSIYSFIITILGGWWLVGNNDNRATLALEHGVTICLGLNTAQNAFVFLTKKFINRQTQEHGDIVTS